MNYDEKDSKNNNEDFFRGDRHTLVIMINAVAVLIVVIIAMAIQLVHLNNKEKAKDSTVDTALAVVSAPAAGEGQEDGANKEKAGSRRDEKEEGSDISAPGLQVETIRKDLDSNKPMVALTFDDGPFGKVTDRLVKILAAHDSRATFFVVGNRIHKYPDSLRRAYENGNQIATHTFDHGDLSKMTKAQIRRELRMASEETKKVIGTGPTMLRPPYGTISKRMRATIKLPMIYWNVDTQDWSSRNKKKILLRCKGIQDGDIVLMHELYSETASAVATLVPRMKKRGYQFVTVEELFYYKGIQAEGGKVYYSGK